MVPVGYCLVDTSGRANIFVTRTALCFYEVIKGQVSHSDILGDRRRLKNSYIRVVRTCMLNLNNIEISSLKQQVMGILWRRQMTPKTRRLENNSVSRLKNNPILLLGLRMAGFRIVRHNLANSGRKNDAFCMWRPPEPESFCISVIPDA